jgi:hypothetical protein
MTQMRKCVWKIMTASRADMTNCLSRDLVIQRIAASSGMVHARK